MSGMAEKKNILTYAGLKQYEDELQDLKVNRRREVAQKIKEARNGISDCGFHRGQQFAEQDFQ